MVEDFSQTISWNQTLLSGISHMTLFGYLTTISMGSTNPNEHHPVRKFLETTSVKGVPRILKSTTYGFRLLWTSAVVSGAVIATYFLVNLFAVYFSYKVGVNINQAPNSTLAFPSVTLCNLNPFVNTGLRPGDIYDYLQGIEEELQSFNISDHTISLFSPAKIYENSLINSADELWPEFIVTCLWYSGTHVNGDNCGWTGRGHRYFTHLGECFTFDPPANPSRVESFSAILYIDKTLKINIPHVLLNPETPYSDGAQVVLHPTGSLPDFSKSLILAPGQSAHILLHATVTIHQSSPYSSCTDSAGPWFYPELHYNRAPCLQLCTQYMTLDACGCIIGQRISTKQLTDKAPFCGNLTGTNENRIRLYLNRHSCIYENVDDEICDELCPGACVEASYSYHTRLVPWPHTAMQLDFWYQYIRNKPYNHRFKQYEAWYYQNETDENELFEALENISKLRDNFLQVSICFTL